MTNSEGVGQPAGSTRRGLTEQLVEQLVAACLEQRDGRGSQQLESILREHPELVEEVRATLAVVDRLGVDRPAVLPGPGCRVGDHRIDGRLGGGAMGVVYAATHLPSGAEVALKMVRPEFVLADKVRARFEREVEAIRRLRHPAVVRVHGWGDQDGSPFLVMERVAGCTLAEVVSHLRGRDPARLSGADLRRAVCALSDVDPRSGAGHELFQGSWEQACLRIARQVARALDHTHRAGVMHRDVKPSNVMITPAGRVLLIDFGLARPTDGTRMTNTGSAVGSELYMAPEVHRGETSGGVATDIYALGVTLRELLALGHPFDAATLQRTRQAILSGASAPLPDHIASETADVCRQAMDFAPQRRYASAGRFARDLTAALAGRAVRATHAGPLLRVVRWGRRRAQPVAMAAALLVAVTGLGLFVSGLEVARSERQRADDLARLVNTEFSELGPAGEGLVAPAVVVPLFAPDTGIALPPLDPYQETDPLALATALMDQAREALEEGDLATAVDRAREAVELRRASNADPRALIESLELLAALHRQAGDLMAASLIEAEIARLSPRGGSTAPKLMAALRSSPGSFVVARQPLRASPAPAAHVAPPVVAEDGLDGSANLGVHHIDLGYEVHGDTEMLLHTAGGVTIDDPVEVELSGAHPKQVTVLIIGWSAGYHPLHFGTLVPDPDVIMPLVCDGNGGGYWELTPDWLVNNQDFPSVYLQFLAKDEGAPVGWAFSNAVRIDAH